MLGFNTKGRTPIVPWKPVVIVLRKHEHRLADLVEVVHALDAQRLFLGALKGRQQQGGEDADDGDDHQQFDEGKAPAAWAFRRYHGFNLPLLWRFCK